MGEWKAGIGPWLCGACGQRHGWDCPYFGPPGGYTRMSAAEIEDAGRRMAADKEAGRWPFTRVGG
jgi:hypothetical protein